MSNDEDKSPQRRSAEEAEREAAGEPEEDVVEFEFNEDPEGKSTSYGAGGEEELVKKIQKLKAELKQAKKEKEEYLTGWQKERADFANYKKEEETRKMAFSHKESWEKIDPTWRKGIEHIYSEMSKIFEEYGVKEIGKIGEIFDPNLHHSIDLVSTDKKEDDHKVAAVIQKGYKLGNRVLRPAGVNFYEYKEPS